MADCASNGMMMPTARLILLVVLLPVLPAVLPVPAFATPAFAADQCSTLPTSALRPRRCNPRAECLRDIPKDLRGEQLRARQRECQNQPTSGTCYGPDTYNPQAECRARQKK